MEQPVIFNRLEYKWLVATAFVVGIFMDIMDSTITNVALPTLGRTFHAGNTTLEWVITGYLLSLAVFVPASGWIGDRFGTKKTFMFALAMFTLTSALCGLSWNIGSLIAFRLLQGIGGGMMTPVGMAMLFRAFPPHERAKASAVTIIPTFIAPTFGPSLGGWLVTDVSWRWIFYLNLPMGIFGLIFTAIYIREHREPTAGGFDRWGFLCSGAGLALILYALSQGPDRSIGWLSLRVLGTGLTGIGLFVALVVIELRVREPMLAFRLFRDRMFRNANVFSFMAMGGMMGALFLLPLYLQQLRGFSALDSGLATFPQALGMIVVVQISSRIYHRVGPRRLMAAGMAGSALTTLMFVFVGLHTDLWWIRGIMLARGLSMGMAMVPMQAAMFSTIKPQDTGRASAITSTNRQVAGSIGVAALATVLVERTFSHVAGATTSAASDHGSLLAFHDAFFVAALISAVGVAFAFLVHDEDAAASMRAPTTVAPEREPVEALAG
jgi:EmrB/QacA subfamily drug resistance transporter